MTKLHITREQLIKEWRIRALPEPLNDPLSGITRIDGYNLDGLIEARMDDWYARLLNTAPLELQAPVDMAASLEQTGTTPDGGGCYRLPDGFKRMEHVLLEGTQRGATILYGAAARLYNPRHRVVDDTPVALIDGPTMTVYPDTPLRAAIMVCDTADGIYHLDSAALGGIEAWY